MNPSVPSESAWYSPLATAARQSGPRTMWKSASIGSQSHVRGHGPQLVVEIRVVVLDRVDQPAEELETERPEELRPRRHAPREHRGWDGIEGRLGLQPDEIGPHRTG